MWALYMQLKSLNTRINFGLSQLEIVIEGFNVHQRLFMVFISFTETPLQGICI